MFCVDRGAITGLHVTISTLLHSLNPAWSVVIHILHQGITSQDLQSVQRTIETSPTGAGCTLAAASIDLAEMKQFSSHAGQGWMAYARLLAVDKLKLDRLIYLDADMLIFADISELWTRDLRGAPVGAASWGTVRESNDRQFYSANLLPLDTPYFNSGVLLIDGDQWIQDDWTTRCIEWGNRFSTNLPSADQTMLNLAFGDVFHQIPRRFNTPVTASRRELGPEDLKDRVIHLVSRPKPWEAMGWLNGQTHHFESALANTDACQFRRPPPQLRDLRNSKKYGKCLKARMTGPR